MRWLGALSVHFIAQFGPRVERQAKQRRFAIEQSIGKVDDFLVASHLSSLSQRRSELLDGRGAFRRIKLEGRSYGLCQPTRNGGALWYGQVDVLNFCPRPLSLRDRTAQGEFAPSQELPKQRARGKNIRAFIGLRPRVEQLRSREADCGHVRSDLGNAHQSAH